MHRRRSIHSCILFSLQWAFLAACDGATSEPLLAQGQTVLGQWARSAQECRRPELILEKSSAAVQTDADGQAVAFSYETVTYASDGPSQVRVELGKRHPYGKTSSKTALTFKLVSPDQIDLIQGNKFVAFRRCSK